jgi:hypothetical protein
VKRDFKKNRAKQPGEKNGGKKPRIFCDEPGCFFLSPPPGVFELLAMKRDKKFNHRTRGSTGASGAGDGMDLCAVGVVRMEIISLACDPIS